MERLLLLSSYLGDEVIKIASISRCHPDIAQEIALLYLELCYFIHLEAPKYVTPRLLFRCIPVEQNNDKYLFLIVM